VVEPEQFYRQFVVWSGGERRGKAWTEFKVATDQSLAILTETEADECRAQAVAVLAHPEAKKLLTGGNGEHTTLWDHIIPPLGGLPERVIPMKARLDYVIPGVAIVDLKGTSDASEEAFMKECVRAGYFQQMALYQDGHTEANCGAELPVFLVAVEHEYPHVVQVYELSAEALRWGRANRFSKGYEQLLETYALCSALGDWSAGYATGPVRLGLPKWLTAVEAA
jgi:hypothetical protein